MKALFLTKYGTMGASSRCRSYQYIPYLEEHGISVSVVPLFDNDYIEALYANGRAPALKVLSYYMSRLATLVRHERFSVVWIEKELFPWLPYWFEAPLLAALEPFVVDFDDAIFHHYDNHPLKIVRKMLGRKIDMIMKRAAMVVVGNDYLAERAHLAQASRVEVIPTVIDLDRYPSETDRENDNYTIGWIGSPSTKKYLDIVGPALDELGLKGKTRLLLVGSGDFTLRNMPVEVRSWSKETEVKDINKFDVGIMPLPDGPWERGKCGYKLIQYMACGKPVVGSPVGVNRELIAEGINGFTASTITEWTTALARLRDNSAERRFMGSNGREMVAKSYCLKVTAPKLAQLLLNVAASNGTTKLK